MKKLIIKRIMIVGCGRIGNALLSGLMNIGYSKKNVILLVRRYQQQKALIKRGFDARLNFKNIPKVELLFLCVKPSTIGTILEHIKNCVLLNQTPIVSFAAAYTYQQYRETMGLQHPIFRARPNIFICIKKGNILFSENIHFKSLGCLIEKFLKKLGNVYRIHESNLGQLTWDSSTLCGVVLTKLIIARLKSLPSTEKKLTTKIIISGLKGFCEYIEEKSKKTSDPIKLFQDICEEIASPLGLNDKAIKYLTDKKFFDIFLNAAALYKKQEIILDKQLTSSRKQVPTTDKKIKTGETYA